MKYLIKNILYFLAYLFHRNHNSKIVYYHDVGTQYTDMGTELELIKKHFTIIKNNGYEIVKKISLRKGQVMICFDDGWAGIYDHKDFFIEQCIFPTVFIAVGLIGQDGYLTEEQIQELQRAGFVFECHSWSHKNLTTFSDDELIHELKDSKETLEKMFGHPFNGICYPQGRFSIHVYQYCKQMGYDNQYSSICGGYYDLEEKGIICRNCAQFSSPREFKWMLNSTSSLFRRRFIKQQVLGGL